MARPRLHADAAARKAAHRAAFQRVDLRLDKDTHAKLAEIAAAIDQPLTVLVESMVKFALTNHDWARFGLTHNRKKQ